MEIRFDVLGIGNAIVDILAKVSDTCLAEQQLEKGSMRLITLEESTRLCQLAPEKTEISGGSVANSMVGLSSLGTRSAYVGIVRDDAMGATFNRDLAAQGVHCATSTRSEGPATGRSVIFITPDGERTMNTFLGICNSLMSDDIPSCLIEQSRILYLEGYLFDLPAAKQAFHKAAQHARNAGRKVALTLSDSFCVHRHRAEFLDFIKNRVDILFANESEIMSLYLTDIFDEAAQRIRRDVPLAVLTRGMKGAVIVDPEAIHHIACQQPISCVIDATGAGDFYAAGFLHAYAEDRSLEACARLGNLCAAEIIMQIGARPQQSLRQIALVG